MGQFTSIDEFNVLKPLPNPNDIGYPCGMDHTISNVAIWFNTLSRDCIFDIFEPLFQVNQLIKSKTFIFETAFSPTKKLEAMKYVEDKIKLFHERILRNEEMFKSNSTPYNVYWEKFNFYLESKGLLLNINKTLPTKKKYR